MAYLKCSSDGAAFFDRDAMVEKGLELREAHDRADPFPYSVIDDFLPVEILDQCLKFFPDQPDPASRTFDRAQERYKTQFNPDYLPAISRTLFQSFNSAPFLGFLQNLTGIEGLIPDPYFMGGGFHEIATGGKLDVHTDFNHHSSLNLERRINVLVYLNKNWKEEYGGNLELWANGMKERKARVAPEFNRCVIFNTSLSSLHGHPDPVVHPDGLPRRSIALYYYTATWNEAKLGRTTQFKPRPGSKDKTDFKVKLSQFYRDVTPPIIVRVFAKRHLKNSRSNK